MFKLTAALVLLLSTTRYYLVSSSSLLPSKCRTLPGDPTFPSVDLWAQLNSSIGGSLLSVVPSAKFCEERVPMCTDAEWNSSTFRGTIPGAMNNINWEQDYTSNPPSLCFHNSTTCGQGNDPMYAINATDVSQIQNGITFATAHNLKVAIKSTGHDNLGRSTARGSLLIWTHHLRNITFFDSFMISDETGKEMKDLGPAVTVGSGVPLNILYEETKKLGRFYVGGSAATVALAGGYVQGTGHSAFSPVFGLGADNALEFKVVLADGTFVTANEFQNPDLFWALRGGGAGSWGVVVSATVRTYPIFSAAVHTASILAPPNTSTADLMVLHARHVFDWDQYRAGQYFFLSTGVLTIGGPPIEGNALSLITYFAYVSAETAFQAMQPLLEEVAELGFVVAGGMNLSDSVQVALANDFESLGISSLLTSRLIPAAVYNQSGGPESIGEGYAKLLDEGVPIVLGHIVSGVKVAENAKIDSAVQSKWRTAKKHIIAVTTWPDSFTPAQVIELKHNFTHNVTPILATMTGESDSGAYMNEADVLEPDFQTVFFGRKSYRKLLEVKAKYDPQDLFIVGAGVGSERWDADGLCLID